MFSARPFISVFFAVWLVLHASLATAQKDDFFDSLIAFHSALFGRYGDEGPLAASALDRLAAILDAWEQSQIAERGGAQAGGKRTRRTCAFLRAAGSIRGGDACDRGGDRGGTRSHSDPRVVWPPSGSHGPSCRSRRHVCGREPDRQNGSRGRLSGRVAPVVRRAGAASVDGRGPGGRDARARRARTGAVHATRTHS